MLLPYIQQFSQPFMVFRVFLSIVGRRVAQQFHHMRLQRPAESRERSRRGVVVFRMMEQVIQEVQYMQPLPLR